MKPTREDVVRLAHEASPDLTWYAAMDNPSEVDGAEIEFLERFAHAMYQRGAENMRERAAMWWVVRGTKIAEGIRALPIGDE